MSLVFAAMLVSIVHIVMVGGLLFWVRKKAVTNGQVKMSYFKTYQDQAPEELIRYSRHFNNQFQAPVLFLITALACVQFAAPALPTVILSWIFVLSRLVHSYVHLGSNKVLIRAQVFFLGFFCILGLWLVMAYQVFLNA